jgi:hypothetical protein
MGQSIVEETPIRSGSAARSNAASKLRVSTARAARLIAIGALFALMAAFAAGCGGTRGDAGADTGTYKVKAAWRFPKTQPLGKPVNFSLLIRNVDTKTIPQLVVTISGLRTFIKQPGAATQTRPVWVPNDVNYSDVTPNSTATGNTYSLGPLAAGAAHHYILPLTPIRRGEHPIGYQLAGNIYGSAKVTLENGNPAADQQTVAVDPTPVFDESVFK